MPDGEPDIVMVLTNINRFDTPIPIAERLQQLSFIPTNTKKWGVAMMGGIRPLCKEDYELLSRHPTINDNAVANPAVNA